MPIRPILRVTAFVVLTLLGYSRWDQIDPRAEELVYRGFDADANGQRYSLKYRVAQAMRTQEGAESSELVAELEVSALPVDTQKAGACFEVHYMDVDLSGHTMIVSALGDTSLNPFPLPTESDFGYEVRLKPTGEILGLKRTGKRTTFPNARLYEERQNTFISFLPKFFVQVAGSRKAPGAQWQTSRLEEVVSPEGIVALLRTVSHFQLQRIDEELAHVTVHFTHEFAAADSLGNSVGRLVHSGGQGELLFDTARGRTISYLANEIAVYELGPQDSLDGATSVHRDIFTQILPDAPRDLSPPRVPGEIAEPKPPPQITETENLV